MTKADLIQMAVEAGEYANLHEEKHGCWLDAQRHQFANLVAAAEREACALVCEAEAAIQKESAKFCKVSIDQRDFSISAAAIRARGQS